MVKKETSVLLEQQQKKASRTEVLALRPGSGHAFRLNVRANGLRITCAAGAQRRRRQVHALVSQRPV